MKKYLLGVLSLIFLSLMFDFDIQATKRGPGRPRKKTTATTPRTIATARKTTKSSQPQPLTPCKRHATPCPLVVEDGEGSDEEEQPPNQPSKRIRTEEPPLSEEDFSDLEQVQKYVLPNSNQGKEKIANSLIQFFSRSNPHLKEKYLKNPEAFVLQVDIELLKIFEEGKMFSIEDIKEGIVFYDKEAFEKFLENPKEGFDEVVLLIGIDLRNVDLREAQLNNAILMGALFDNNRFLINAKFKNALLHWTSFKNTRIENCNFTGADLTGASFYKSTIINSTLNRVSLRNTSFVRVTLYLVYLTNICGNGENPDFSHAKIEDSIFGKVYFDGAKLKNATIRGIRNPMVFRNCRFENTDFEDLIIENVFFFKPFIPVGTQYTKKTLDTPSKFAVATAGILCFVYPPAGVGAICGLATRDKYYFETIQNRKPCKKIMDIQRAPNCVFLNPEGFGEEVKEFLEGIGAQVVYKEEEDSADSQRILEQAIYSGIGNATGAALVDNVFRQKRDS